MAFSLNAVKLIGHIGKDPSITTTPGGKLIVNMSIATGERVKDQQGNYQDKTEWHNLVAFSRQAEIIRDYIKKGAFVFVDGKLQTRSWEKDGQKHYRTEIIVNRVGLLDTKNGSNGSSQSQSSSNGNGYNLSAKGDAYETADITDEDIPFNAAY
jgi:single-strand DNA-binding protein